MLRRGRSASRAAPTGKETVGKAMRAPWTTSLPWWPGGRQSPDIKTIFQRAERLNGRRLEQARSLLTPRQQLFLDFLPLLFHCNHPSLPGFQSLSSPCGIRDYRPGPELLERLRRHLSASFQMLPSADAPAIEALYLMGSIGSIAHAHSSDVDVWVCHGPALTDEQRQQLRARADAISHYAMAALGLEVHFFLMCAEEFRAGERKALTAEDCGSTQHFLLLDEFYRSAIRLAGKQLLWWFVPTAESDYDSAAETLKRKHRWLARHTLDFGTVPQIPAGEYVGAGIWQLFKAIRAPHKSLIKLLLIEAYANDHPDNLPISQGLKQRLYASVDAAFDADPYQLIYQRLERYLVARDESERLELLRRALYFKTELKLSQLATEGNWRQQALHRLVREWGWSLEHLRNLDMRNRWRVTRASQEHRELVRELTGSYRFLQAFARNNAAEQLISSREMTVLGRKLFSAFERQPDKIEWINHDFIDDLAEKHLSFCYLGKSDPSQPSWAVVSGQISLARWPLTKPLRESDNLPALICWCLCNGLIDADTHFHLASDHPHHHRGKLEHLVRQLRQTLPPGSYAGEASKHERFEAPKRVESLTCFVGNSSRSHSRDIPVVRHIDLVTVNSWGEILCKAYLGEHAVADALYQILKRMVGASKRPELRVQTFSGDAHEDATTAFEALLKEALTYFERSDCQIGDRFLFNNGRQYYLLQQLDTQLALLHAGNQSELLALLGADPPGRCRTDIATSCQTLSALRCVTQHQAPDCIQVFFRRREEAADVFVQDGQGAIHYQALLCDDSAIMLAHLRTFIIGLRDEYSPGTRIAWYELTGQADQWQAGALSTTPRADTLRIGIQMLAHRSSDDSHRFDVSVNQKTFHFAQHGKDILQCAVDYICEETPRNRLRFCYVNQIQYRERNGKGLTVTARIGRALQHKAQIEEALNSALLARME